ncbi:hypothetical protein GPECTOR_5g124 [Gonium pectorale]|uniref:Glycosyltransferase 2-like domain-containing protein n=1 Tax=Gonium pectorale TaxID=33097 RepID=A0A150GW79_GONPE|nr:hypothetical protein GPECTOR_5g124 [Gonium pectorale]|eukprot:KXZ54013.1 hypothetical protein GPECTOR_5g124 [Gonium pectorale]
MSVMSRTLAIAIFLASIALLVDAGPELNPFQYCSTVLKKLRRNERQTLHRAVVAVQGLYAQLELRKLDRATSTATTEQLQAWLNSNQTVVSRPWAISKLAQRLQAVCRDAGIPCELVVNADNPHEASEWTTLAKSTKGFVVPLFSANIHEARGYNRAARAAQGRFLIIWQDDQLPPSSGSWLRDLQKLFSGHPRLAVVGMNTFRMCKHAEATNRFGAVAWEPDPVTGVRWSYVQEPKLVVDQTPTQLLMPIGAPPQFNHAIPNVDFAPLVVRASAYELLGGLEESYTRKGDCGIWGDWELCTRAWVAGWTVGYLPIEGREGDGQDGGTHVGSNAEKCWGRQQYVSAGSFDKRYGSPAFQDELCGKVWKFNMAAFSLSDPSKCPYGGPETKFGNCTRSS